MSTAREATHPPLSALVGIRVIGVRHHSPACADGVRERIRACPPKVLLIEGPRDATPLVGLILASDARPPFALHALRPKSETKSDASDEEGPLRSAWSSVWPFLDYSPELAAIREAAAVGAAIAFVDLPASSHHEADPQDAASGVYADARLVLARQAGFESFEEWWEARIEQASSAVALDAVAVFGAQLRTVEPPDDECRRREASMVTGALAALELVESPDQLLAVVGAYHAPAFTSDPPSEGLLAPEWRARREFLPFEPDSQRPLADGVTIVPYSFRRTWAAYGYGAGTPAPAFLQKVWEHGGGGEGYRATTISAFSRIAAVLREGGHTASLADVVEAQCLAEQLAGLRDKPAPGLLELRTAATSAIARGRAELLDSVLDEIVVGHEVGAAPSGAPSGPLQNEFYREVGRLGLPVMDIPKEVVLRLTSPTDAERSAFLHQLTTLEVPYATQVVDPASGAVGGLSEVREKWIVEWNPLVDTRLVETQRLGASLAEAAARTLTDAIARCTNAAEATELLSQAVLAGAEGAFAEILSAADRLSAAATDMSSLAKGAARIAALRRYGAVRPLPIEPLENLLARLHSRGRLALPGAVDCDDAAMGAIAEGMRLLVDAARTDSDLCDPTGTGSVLADIAAGRVKANPRARGLALALLTILGIAGPEEIRSFLRANLSPSVDAAEAAGLLLGLMGERGAFSVGDRGMVGAVDAFVRGMPVADFVRVAPFLRRAFSDTSRADVRTLIATIERVSSDPESSRRREIRTGLPPDLIREIDEIAGRAAFTRWGKEAER